jgi:hypothetical protein
VSTFVLWVGLLPVRSTAVQRDVSDRGFTDVQASGPAAAWAHTHTFTPLSDGRTRIDEHIEYAHKPGLWGVATRILFSKPNLWLIVSYRRFVIRWFLRPRSVLRRSIRLRFAAIERTAKRGYSLDPASKFTSVRLM